MAEEHQNPATEAIPGTPRIREVRIESGSEYFNQASTTRGGFGAEIDVSPQFVSDQKTVTGFGSWVLGDNCDCVGEYDIKRMEENAANLEKDLIVKELETLDFLEALGSTKSIVEDFKRKLHKQARRETPEHFHSHIKEMTEECNDLVMTQSYVESLNMKTKEEKDLPGGVASLAEELNSLRLKPEGTHHRERFETNDSQCEEVKMVVETNDTAFKRQSKDCLKTAEMRLVAARKVEEAARAAEALAIAEITVLSSGRNQDGLCFLETPTSPLTLQALMNKDLSIDISRVELMRKLEEANEEVKLSKQDLETALNRVEIARVKQLEAENAFRKWNIESWKDQKAVRAKRSMKGGNFTRDSFLSHVNQQQEPRLNDLPKPVLKRNVSIGNVLNWKQVPTIDEKQLVPPPRRKFRFIHSQVSEQKTKHSVQRRRSSSWKGKKRRSLRSVFSKSADRSLDRSVRWFHHMATGPPLPS